MDLRALSCYRAVVELGSISKASAYLRIAQPALSRIIQKLEHALGVELLMRSSRGVAPTAAGELLLERTVKLESSLADTLREVGSYAREVGGPLRIGVQPSMSHTIMPAVLRRYHAEHPKVELRVFTGYSADMIDGLLDETMDFAVVDTPTHDHRDLTVFPLWVETLHFIGPTTTPHAALFDRDTVPLADVLALPLILPSPRYSVRKLIEATAAREHLRVAPIMEVDGSAMIFALVKSGLGHTLMPALGASSFSRGRLRSVATSPGIERPLSIVIRTAMVDERKVGTMQHLFREEVSALADTEPFSSIRIIPSQNPRRIAPSHAGHLKLISS